MKANAIDIQALITSCLSLLLHYGVEDIPGMDVFLAIIKRSRGTVRA